jgi:hypothetical protein
MPRSKRVWTDDDIAKLKNLAGKIPVRQIAALLDRSLGATVVEASKLKLSLRVVGRPASLDAERERVSAPGATSFQRE